LNDYTYEFIPLRGITESTLRHFNVKTKVDKEGKPISIGFRYPNGAYKVRWLDRKDFYSEGEIGKAGLFGRDKFPAGCHKYVTITEGELDALSLYQVTHAPCVSIQSAGTGVRDCTVDRDWLASFERVYLAFDDDAPGRDAAAAVARLFDYNRVYQVKFSPKKDANEYLKEGLGDELKNIWWNSRKFLPSSVISSFADFKKILEQPPMPSVPYPFRCLNEMTYGIRTSESVLFTAQEGVGKTELMHAIEYHLLKETNNAIGAIFLEEPKLRHLQAVAGLELRKPAHLPDGGCTGPEISAALQQAVGQDDRLHLYSHFGSDDPAVLLDTIRFLVSARACRYVILDHINMVVSGLAGEDERKALDFISTRLEMMVKELDFALIMVAHVNDFGQTRGSRYISKIADIRIDASRDLTSEDPVVRNTTNLMVSKNRFSGKTGLAGKLLFDPSTYTFAEEWSDGYLDHERKEQSDSNGGNLSRPTLDAA
jgi:twinkle protein